MRAYYIIVYILTTATLVESFRTGAPNYVCKSMTPGHNGGPQLSRPPFTMSLSRSTVEPGGSTTVSLRSLGDVRFMGFLCAASALSDDSNHTLGTFSLQPGFSDQAQLLTCTQSTVNTAVTHVNNDPKSYIGFDWTVPADASIGSVFKIRCTFVKSFYECWTNNLLLITVVKQDQNNVTGNSTAKINSISSSKESTAQGNMESSNSSQTVIKTNTSHGSIDHDNSIAEGSLPPLNFSDLPNETYFNPADLDDFNKTFINELFKFLLPNKEDIYNASNNPEDILPVEESFLTGSSMRNNSTESTIATFSSLSLNLSIHFTTEAQNNSLNRSINRNFIFSDHAQNKSININNIQKNFTGHVSPTSNANLVPDFILQNPDAYFLNSSNIRHHFSNARRIQRKKGGKGCIISV